MFNTGPSDGWSCGSYTLTDADGDGIWEGTFSLPSSIYIVQMVGQGLKQLALYRDAKWRNIHNRLFCGLITVGAITTTDTWGSCSPCVYRMYRFNSL